MTATEALPRHGPYCEAALDYLAAGLTPVPLPARSKALALKGWTGAHGAGQIFTVDDLWAAPYGLSETAHPSASGGLVRTAMAAGTIRRVGFATSPRLSHLRSTVSLWRGARQGVRS